MPIFLLQQRQFRATTSNNIPSFPAELVARIQFRPEDSFGVSGGHTRTTIKRATHANLIWNANEGVSFWKGELIDLIESRLSIGNLTAEWNGSMLIFKVPVNNMDEVNNVTLSANQILPAVLSFRLRVFVWIKEFLVYINGVGFRLEIAHHRFGITIATTEHNRQQVEETIHDWINIKEKSLRLIMAMYYFRHAKRLVALEPDRQSMTAEVVLNLTKAIEIIFSSDRGRLRKKASEFGFQASFIEGKIVPLFLIRNELDVAHVISSPLTSEQNQTLIDFIDRALTHVHTLLPRIVDLERLGQVDLDSVPPSVDKKKGKLLEKIKKYASSE